MREITLTHGEKAQVSNCDYDYLSCFKWHMHNGYPARMERGQIIYMHEEIVRRMEDEERFKVNV